MPNILKSRRGLRSALPTLQSGELGFCTDTHEFFVGDGSTNRCIGSPVISRGGTFYNDSGITSAVTVVVWRATFNCTVINVRGFRVGGSGATINARKNGSLTHLGSDLSLATENTWIDGGSVQNTSYVSGDYLEIMVVTAGSPTQIVIQVDFRR